MLKLAEAPSATSPRRRTFGPQVPAEGGGGVFTQSWFPICLASEIAAGSVKGYPFLDGRVVVYRGEDGVARVMSAYCPHLGADLAEGCVVGDRLQCAFHLWEFDGAGACRKTGIGDPAPPRAQLFAFPTEERHGLIWAFNGETPLFELPDWPFPSETLVREAHVFPVNMPVDPWIVCAQTPDIQHTVLLHKFELLGADPAPLVEWGDYTMFYPLHIRTKGRVLDVRGGIVGTSIFIQTGTLDGRWFGFMTAMGLPRPSESTVFSVLVAERTDDEAEVRAFLQEAFEYELSIASEDAGIAASMHFRVGSLTRQDATLAKFLERIRNFPRAHPSAEFIV